ncbi:MAG: hypothetical protein IV086_18220 [Hyphomonadaceae bacterium]|nr:MAG: hypothetical protein FD160_2426 [Caulobacteraceae bacterium]MBT9447637.1 hypothetical protein [Hyphomonadaceae bacterium]TPW04585.1 MAG: hypothetical protein FD124_2530 [Alphaproteobacteria bacterium]
MNEPPVSGQRHSVEGETELHWLADAPACAHWLLGLLCPDGWLGLVARQAGEREESDDQSELDL